MSLELFVKVELEQELNTDMTGLCGKHNITGIIMRGMELDCMVAVVTLTAVLLAAVTVLLVGKVQKLLLFSYK